MITSGLPTIWAYFEPLGILWDVGIFLEAFLLNFSEGLHPTEILAVNRFTFLTCFVPQAKLLIPHWTLLGALKVFPIISIIISISSIISSIGIISIIISISILLRRWPPIPLWLSFSCPVPPWINHILAVSEPCNYFYAPCNCKTHLHPMQLIWSHTSGA